MDRLEVKFSSIVQRRTETLVTVRLYRLGDDVTLPDGSTTYPRVLLRTVTATLGPVHPWQRFVELYRERAAALDAQFGWNLSEIVCSL